MKLRIIPILLASIVAISGCAYTEATTVLPYPRSRVKDVAYNVLVVHYAKIRQNSDSVIEGTMDYYHARGAVNVFPDPSAVITAKLEPVGDNQTRLIVSASHADAKEFITEVEAGLRP
jgi:hypothetical protein